MFRSSNYNHKIAHGRAFVLRKFIDLHVLQKVLFLTIMKNDQIYYLGKKKLKIKTRCVLKIICQENFKNFNFCSSDNRYKENHAAETRIKKLVFI